jgi:hypothetical protein
LEEMMSCGETHLAVDTWDIKHGFRRFPIRTIVDGFRNRPRTDPDRPPTG